MSQRRDVGLSKLATILLVAVTTVNAQCYALCLASQCEHAAKHQEPANSSGSEDCHHHDDAPDRQQSSEGPCGHELCVSEEGQKATPVAASPASAVPVLITASIIVAPDYQVFSRLVEDPSPPPLVSPAAKAILRI